MCCEISFPKRGEVPTVHYHVPSQPLPENLDWREYGKWREVTFLVLNYIGQRVNWTYQSGTKVIDTVPQIKTFFILDYILPPNRPSYNVGIVYRLSNARRLCTCQCCFGGGEGGGGSVSGKNVFFSTKVEQLIKKTYFSSEMCQWFCP